MKKEVKLVETFDTDDDKWFDWADVPKPEPKLKTENKLFEEEFELSLKNEKIL